MDGQTTTRDVTATRLVAEPGQGRSVEPMSAPPAT